MLTFQWRSKLAAKMSTIFLKFLLILETVLLWAEMHNNRKRLNVFGFEDWPKMKVSKRWARKQCQLVVSQWWPCEEKIELLKPQKSNTFPVHRPQCSLNFDGDEDEEYENRNIQTDRTSLMLEFDGDEDEDEDEYRIWGWEYPDRQTDRTSLPKKPLVPVTVLNFNLQASTWIPKELHNAQAEHTRHTAYSTDQPDNPLQTMPKQMNHSNWTVIPQCNGNNKEWK